MVVHRCFRNVVMLWSWFVYCCFIMSNDDAHVAAADPSIRQPLCNYYSSDKRTLEREIDWCQRYFAAAAHEEETDQRISHASSKVAVPTPPSSILLVPHGAFCDSGPLVAHALRRQAASFRNVDTVVLIGTEHASASRHKVCCSDFARWRTPLGDVPVSDELLAKVKEWIPTDASAFVQEHSIENQLPFLQSVFATRHWGMLALSVHGNVDKSDLSYISHIGERLASVLKGKGNVAVVATTDYTHAGPYYGEMPVRTDESIADYIRSRDLPFLQFLCGPQLPSAEEVWQRGRQISMCGLGSTLLTVELARKLGRTRANLLLYRVGSDICERGLQDQTGFATVLFEQ